MYRTIWFIMLGSGGTLFTLSIILFFVFNVPELLDELSGRKAKRQIKRLKKLSQSADISDMSTEDIYSSVTSGSLLSRELKLLENKDILENTSDLKGKVVDVHIEKSNGVSHICEEENTTLMEEDQVTNYMSDVDETSYMEDRRVPCVIRVLEEQTSIGR